MPTRNQLLAVDEMRSEFALEMAASQSDLYIAHKVFAPTMVGGIESGTYYVYSAGNKHKLASGTGIIRADKADPNYIEWAVESSTYKAQEYELAVLVSERERNNALGALSPEDEGVEITTEKLLKHREVRAVTLLDALTPNATATTYWNVSGALPFSEIETGILTLMKATGRRPTAMIVEGDIGSALKSSIETANSAGAAISDRIKYTMGLTNARITPALIADLFDIPEVIMAEATYDTAREGMTASNAMIWATKKIYLIVQDVRSDSAQSQFATFGKTFVVQDLHVRRWDEPSKNNSEAFEVREVCQEKVTSTSHIYVLDGILA
jgi:hypothetical protein